MQNQKVGLIEAESRMAGTRGWESREKWGKFISEY